MKEVGRSVGRRTTMKRGQSTYRIFRVLLSVIVIFNSLPLEDLVR